MNSHTQQGIYYDFFFNNITKPTYIQSFNLLNQATTQIVSSIQIIIHFKLYVMKSNIGSNDKLIRLALAIVLIVLFYKEILTGALGIAALVVALLLTVTSLVNFCPLYRILGINTDKKKEIK